MVASPKSTHAWIVHSFECAESRTEGRQRVKTVPHKSASVVLLLSLSRTGQDSVISCGIRILYKFKGENGLNVQSVNITHFLGRTAHKTCVATLVTLATISYGKMFIISLT